MNEIESINVKISFFWRVVGCTFIFATFVLMTVVAYIWLIAERKPPIDSLPMTIFTQINLILCDFLLLPCIIGCYPRWIVKVVGEKKLLWWIDRCRSEFSAHLSMKINWRSPSDFFMNPRVMWWMIVFGAFVLGLLMSI
jgi:hypothetical protein